MASKALIFAGLVLLLAAVCHAESQTTELEESDRPIERSKRGILGWIIASWGDALKLFLDGLNKGVKGLLTGLTYAFLGFFGGCSNGLQLWRLGIYFGLHAIVDLAQNLLETVLLSPLHTNFLWTSVCTLLTKLIFQESDRERHLSKRLIPVLTTVIAGIGDGLKYIIDGLNVGTKGFLTGLTYLVLGWWTGWSNGLQKWRLGFYDLFNAVVNLAQNVLDTILLSPLHTNFLNENHV